jgi:hypothetical protein
MIRRRRRVREIPFSFDSFLDIVANVVGIIIRMILVVWVGARSYSSLQNVVKPAPKAEMSAAVVEDPLSQELERHRRELAAAQQRLLAQMRQLEESQQEQTGLESELEGLASRRQRVEAEQTALSQTATKGDAAAQAAALTSAELRQRSQKLAEEIQALEQQPIPKKTLHYRTPVSRPVQSEELFFECRKGRVSFIDIAALLAEVRQQMEEKGKLLRTQWQISDVTGTVGAFRLRYEMERERGLLDAIGNTATPEANAGFRYGITSWQIEPIAASRGESATEALAANSEFRQIVDTLDSQQTAVTFWVYADSFALFRRLRDYLYERDLVVAGRPLPEGIPISSSRRGTVSRGQ